MAIALHNINTPRNIVEEQRTKLLEHNFKIEQEHHHRWPGLLTYLDHVEHQATVCDWSCFEPIWKVLSYSLPIVIGDVLKFMNDLASRINSEHREAFSIDELLKSFLAARDKNFNECNAEEVNRARTAVFQVISWLTTIYIVPLQDGLPGHFRIEVPWFNEDKRDEQIIDNAKRPIGKLVRGFSHLLPTTEDVTRMLESVLPGLIHAASLNVSSLMLVDIMRIGWTNVMSFHLLFNPLN